MDIKDARLGVRIITAAPDTNGVLDAVHELDQRGIVFSIGRRYSISNRLRRISVCLLRVYSTANGIAISVFATEAVRHGSRLNHTHLQRDASIASPRPVHNWSCWRFTSTSAFYPHQEEPPPLASASESKRE